jgi:acyl-CoA thioesterase FadM
MIGKLGVDEKGPYYEYLNLVTLTETNAEGTVSHDKFAQLFGKVRELAFLEAFPKESISDIGKTLLFHTRVASYDFKKSFRLGDQMLIRIRILKVGNSSFEMGAEFINYQTKEVYVEAKQVIVLTDIQGKPIEIPSNFKDFLLKSIASQ